MISTTTRYDIGHLIAIEVTKQKGMRGTDFELIIGGEGKAVSRLDLQVMIERFEEFKKDWIERKK